MTTTGGAFGGGLVGAGATIVVNNLENNTKATANRASISALGNQSINVVKTDGSGATEAINGVAIAATSKDNLNTTIGTAAVGNDHFHTLRSQGGERA